MSEKVYLAVLHKLGFTHKEFFRIFEHTTNYKDFYENLSYGQLSRYKISDKKIEKILLQKEKVSLEKIKKQLDDLAIQIIVYGDTGYPDNLKHIFNPPFLLYLRGEFIGKSLSIIGTRNITSYGKKTIEGLVPEIGKYFSIVSGGAIGCDYYAHKIALEHRIRTLCVFGTGIDIFYPKSSERLFMDILKQGGGLVSIFPLGEPGNPYNFPIRNEIVAGLSQGVVVIEAKEKSGSLITAKLALDLGKDLFAIPGDIFKPYSRGCNTLIGKGEAKLVLTAENVLSEYNINAKKKGQKKIEFSSEKERDIYDILLCEPLNIDELSIKMHCSFDELLLHVSMMELSGYIKKGDLGKYEVF